MNELSQKLAGISSPIPQLALSGTQKAIEGAIWNLWYWGDGSTQAGYQNPTETFYYVNAAGACVQDHSYIGMDQLANDARSSYVATVPGGTLIVAEGPGSANDLTEVDANKLRASSGSSGTTLPNVAYGIHPYTYEWVNGACTASACPSLQQATTQQPNSVLATSVDFPVMVGEWADFGDYNWVNSSGNDCAGLGGSPGVNPTAITMDPITPEEVASPAASSGSSGGNQALPAYPPQNTFTPPATARDAAMFAGGFAVANCAHPSSAGGFCDQNASVASDITGFLPTFINRESG